MAIWKNIALILVLSAVSVIAEEAEENVTEQNSTDVEEGRGRRRFYKFLIKARNESRTFHARSVY